MARGSDGHKLTQKKETREMRRKSGIENDGRNPTISEECNQNREIISHSFDELTV
jgi:hypothetical protein